MQHIAPWEEEGHKCKNNISGTFAIKVLKEASKSTALEQVVACALVTQRARVRSPVGTGFRGEVFSGFFLTCKRNVRKL